LSCFGKRLKLSRTLINLQLRLVLTWRSSITGVINRYMPYFLPERCSICVAASVSVLVPPAGISVTAQSQTTLFHTVILTETARWEEINCKDGDAMDGMCADSNVPNMIGSLYPAQRKMV
jgi:hypothetical protein